MVTKKSQKRRRACVLVATAVLLAAIALLLAWAMGLLPPKHYTEEDFDIVRLTSSRDENQNGVDDYTDLLLGARRDAKNKPRYDGSYHEGGYPPDDVGVCTDVIWRAFAHAGYDLKALVDADIAAYAAEYPGLDETGPDPNIDFRRVRNLTVFFARHAESLTLDTGDIAAFQPGDIVVFKGETDHIAIISDRRNKEGVPWLIHNGGQPNREEDAMGRLLLFSELCGHYRWPG